jgi:hypothetical protein
MNPDTFKEVQGLERMTVGELKEKYLDVFDEETRSNNKPFLQKRIAWRIQALAEGNLSERARKRAKELARDADLRIRAPRDPVKPGSAEARARSVKSRLSSAHDPRVPLPGVLLHREYQGRDIVVRVLDEGFEFEDRRYTSLTAIACEVTGGKWNGFVFFGLNKAATKQNKGRK